MALTSRAPTAYGRPLMADRPTAIKDALRETLRDLVALHGVSGFEQSLVQYFRERVKGLADAVEVDRYGNVTATRRGRQDRPRLMISAHLDEIGFIVKGIEPDGFLRFDRLGGTADAFSRAPRRRLPRSISAATASPPSASGCRDGTPTLPTRWSISTISRAPSRCSRGSCGRWSTTRIWASCSGDLRHLA